MKRAACLTLVLCGAGVLGCDGNCFTPNVTTWVGSSDYVASVEPDGPGHGFFGSASATLRTHDFTPWQARDCSGAGRYTFDVAGCSLDANTEANFNSYGFVGTTSSIPPDQICMLPVTGGTATIRVTSGALSFGAGKVAQLDLGGDITDWLGETPTSGHFDLHFTGSTAADL